MISFKKIGLLETVVLLSAIYVFSTLIWTATTRSAVQEKANLVKSNHETIVFVCYAVVCFMQTR